MNQPAPISPPRDSLVRFTIRDLLVLTFWCSIILAVMAAIAQRLPDGQRSKFLLGVGIGAGVVVVASVAAMTKRRRIECQAGERLSLVSISAWSPAWRIAAIFFFVSMLFLTATMFSANFLAGGAKGVMLSCVLLWIVFVMARTLTAAMWRRLGAIEFCERGLIHEGLQYIPTKSIVECHWGTAKPNRLLVRTNLVRYNIDVHPSRRAALSEELTAHVPVFRAQKIDTPSSEAS